MGSEMCIRDRHLRSDILVLERDTREVRYQSGSVEAPISQTNFVARGIIQLGSHQHNDSSLRVLAIVANVAHKGMYYPSKAFDSS